MVPQADEMERLAKKVANEAEPPDEVSDSRSETEETSPLPRSKKESINALEQEPQCAVQDSLEDIPSHFPPVAFRSSTPIEAMKALKAESEAPPLIGNEEPKAGQEQNNLSEIIVFIGIIGFIGIYRIYRNLSFLSELSNSENLSKTIRE